MNKYVKELVKAVALGCIIFVVLQLLGLAFGGRIRWNHHLLVNFTYTMFYTVCIYVANAFVFITLDRIYKHDRFNRRRIAIGFVTSFAATVMSLFLLRGFISTVIEHKTAEEFYRNESFADYFVSIVIFFFISLFIHAFYLYKAYQENKVREQKIIAGTASAKFESLKNQIDPHFLFNSLNVLSSLIEENPEAAQKFTTSLSKVYRYVLEQKDKDLVPVSEELDFAKTYMNLLKMRFENSLFYELPESGFDEDSKVVPLSLQLLLENTVKHNVATEQKPLRIRIFIENGYLCISNDLHPKVGLDERQGVGLQNIINRYSIVTHRKIQIEETADTFMVRIPVLTRKVKQLPEMESEAQLHYAQAKKRVEEIKGFYGNLTSYLIVMLGITLINLLTYPKFLWFIFPAIGWGVGVLFHGLSVYNALPLCGKDWEERKIRQLLEKESNAKWK
ncbi:MAG: histidine kinase [Flavobacterium sp.]|nr:MAG: histidine kinase [Flavobacterium sp.]